MKNRGFTRFILAMSLTAAMGLNLVGSSLSTVFAANEPEEFQTDATASNLDMWYDEPTFDDSGPKEGSSAANTNWQTEALPIGNGHMGALIYGGVKNEQLTLNEKTLWSGGPGTQGHNFGNWPEEEQEEKAANLKKVQDMINEQISVPTGKVASMLANDNETFLRTYGSYQAFCDLNIDMGHADTGYTNYLRGLDLDTAVSAVEYDLDGIHYKREYFLSYPDMVLVARYTADRPGAISMTAGLECRQDTGFEITAQNNTIKLRGVIQDNGLIYEGQAAVSAENGTTQISENSVSVAGADAVTIVFSAATDYKQEYPSYRGEDPSGIVTERVENASSKTYEQLKDSHIGDYSELYGRVRLDIGQKRPTLTTDALVSNYPNLSEDDCRYYETLAFDYGRYLLIQSSRAGSLPANLQGIWNPKQSPPWQSDYHLNINLQMNYWGANAANLDETVEPLIDFMKAQVAPGHETAGIIYQNTDPETWVIHNPTNAFGHTGLQAYANGFWYPESSAWLLRHMMEHYSYTQDETFLNETLYPLMRGNMKFWMDYLTEDPRDPGALVCNPSLLPEEPPFTAGGSMSQQIVADLFENYMEISEISGNQDEFYDEVRTAYEKLDKGLKISEENGMIRAWKYMEGNPASQHRHLNQAYALYPSNDISFDEDAELMQAEKIFVDSRGDAAVGWSRAWKTALWARLQNPERAYSVYRGLLGDLTRANLFMQHPPFQIDANLGIVGGVAEMLLQSHNGYLDPLLGVSEAWEDGSVTGLKARGDFVVDMEWSDQTLDRMTVTSQSGGELKVKLAHLDKATVTKNGQPISMTPSEEIANLYSLETQQGDVVVIERSAQVVSAPKGFEAAKDLTDGRVYFSWNSVRGAEKYTVKRIHNGKYETVVETTDLEGSFADPVKQTQYVVTATVNGVESMPSLFTIPDEMGETIVSAPVSVTGFYTGDVNLQMIVSPVEGAQSYRVYKNEELLLSTPYTTIAVADADRSAAYSVCAVINGHESEKVQASISDSPALENVLLNKPLTASSNVKVNGNLPLSKAVNGIADSANGSPDRWSVTDIFGSYTVTADLQGTYRLDTLKIMEWTSKILPTRSTNTKVEVLNSQGQWQTVKEGFPLHVGEFIPVEMGGVEASQIRFTFDNEGKFKNSACITEITCSSALENPADKTQLFDALQQFGALNMGGKVLDSSVRAYGLAKDTAIDTLQNLSATQEQADRAASKLRETAKAAAEAGDNLFFNQSVSTQVSALSTFPAKNMADGDVSTRFAAYDDGDSVVATVDLQETHTFNAFYVQEYLSPGTETRGKETTVEVFDGTDWNTIVAKQSLTSTPDQENDTHATTEFKLDQPITGSQVRFTFVNSEDKRIQIYELQAAGEKAEAVPNIVAVKQLNNLTVEYATPFAELNLPSTVDVVLDNGSEQTASVAWSERGYDPNRAGSHTLTGTLSSTQHFANPQGLTASVTVTVRPESEPIKVDKTILKAVLNYADEAKENGEYAGAIDSVRTSFDAAYEAALAVYNNTGATQQQVDSAWIALMKEIHKLGFQRGGQEQLETVLAYAKGIDLRNYVDKGQAEFSTALAAAEALLGDGDALQSEIDPAVSALVDALADLRYKADKTLLALTLNRAYSLDLSKYTPESAARFNAAKQLAEDVYHDSTVNIEEQIKVDRAEQNLAESIASLLPITGDSLMVGQSSAPRTGDTASPLIAAFLLIGAAVVVQGRKRRR